MSDNNNSMMFSNDCKRSRLSSTQGKYFLIFYKNNETEEIFLRFFCFVTSFHILARERFLRPFNKAFTYKNIKQNIKKGERNEN